MKVGIYDIKDIPSAVYVKGPLLVRLNKLKSLFWLLVIIIIFGGFIAGMLSLEKRPLFKLSFTIFLFILAIRNPLELYLLSIKNTPYLLVDEDGVSFKNEKYPWPEIESIKFEVRRVANYSKKILHLLLKDKKKIVIDIEGFLDTDIDKIAGYINHYYA
jgi:hypothetical protein